MGRVIRPSTSLAEFAEKHDLDLRELGKLAKCTGLKRQFVSFNVNYYHLADLEHWLKQNSLRITANARI